MSHYHFTDRELLSSDRKPSCKRQRYDNTWVFVSRAGEYNVSFACVRVLNITPYPGTQKMTRILHVEPTFNAGVIANRYFATFMTECRPSVLETYAHYADVMMPWHVFRDALDEVAPPSQRTWGLSRGQAPLYAWAAYDKRSQCMEGIAEAMAHSR